VSVTFETRAEHLSLTVRALLVRARSRGQAEDHQAAPSTPNGLLVETPQDSIPKRIGPTLQPWLVGLYSVCLSSAGAWIPWYWYDEANTVAAARKPWSDLLSTTVTQVDAVHGLYYAVMKLWTAAFGTDVVSTRSLSAVFVGLTSVLLVYLGRQMFTNRVGIVAGLIYPLIPVTIWMGGEARSYSASALVCTAFVVAFQRAAVQRFDWRRWFLAVVAFILAAWVFIFSVLVLIPLALLWRRKLHRENVIRILGCAIPAALAVLPIFYLAFTQRSQVDWVVPRSLSEVGRTVIEYQYFRGLHPFALVALVLIIIAGVLVAIRRDDSWQKRDYLVFLVLWCLIPTVVLALADVAGIHELYYWRYLAFTAPAVALLMSAGIGRLPRAACLVAVSVVGIAALPAFAQRNDVMQKSSWSYAVQVMNQRAAAGDAWISYSQHMPAVAEIYPQAFRGMPLLNDRGAAFSPGMLALRGGPLQETFVAPEHVKRIWYFSDSFGFERKDDDFALLDRQGFRRAWTSREHVGPNALTIYLFERTSP
jgi:mannosyltransferase